MRRGVEVAVIGGGPAGSAAALALRARGIEVALVERSCYEAPRIGETLPAAVQCELASLGVWGRFLSAGHLPSPGVRCVWGGEEHYDRSCLFDPYGPGWHIDRRAFDAMLAEAAAARGTLVLRGVRVVGVARGDRARWRVQARSSTGPVVIDAATLIDATGRKAALARRFGATRASSDRLVAVFRFFGRAPAGLGVSPTAVEAVAQGWWYSAPLPSGRLVATLMTDADLDPRELLHDGPEWAAWLQQAPITCSRVAGCTPLGPARLTAAGSSLLSPACGEGWLAIGDAAVALDPLSGDGVRRALRSGIRAAELIVEGQTAPPDQFQRAFASYLEARDGFYGRESRWPASPFWQRRRPPAARSAPATGEPRRM